VRAFALLQAGAPSDLCSALSGNICRCTGYQYIVRAVKEVRLSNLADEPGCSGKDVADMSWSEAGGGDLWN
jgi:xanthine dehydrogenase iron-sulfur cluster and FAD-binding subunit A